MNNFANPMGTDGFEFVEFAAPDAAPLHELFKAFGFTAIARHKSINATLYRQGDCNFIVNEEPNSFAADFAKRHGPCSCGFAIRVKDARSAHARATALEAAMVQSPQSVPVDAPHIKGIGGSLLYLVDQYGDNGSAYGEFEPIDGVDQTPQGFGLTYIDHLTHNVFHGNMEQIANFYERLFNFREIRYFDIKGAQTGLVSKAMTSPDGKVRIPINESSDDKSQINEYLREYDGEGIQHIALFTDNIYQTVEKMREQGVKFLDTPDTYYDVIDQRIPNHSEDIDGMRRNKILIDADQETGKQLLLQIFTETNIGPIFFEIIQRKGNEGFGEGNFTALFEAIERDQERRGVL